MRCVSSFFFIAAPRLLAGVDDLARQAFGHRLLAARARVLHQPAHAERHPPHRPHLDRDLIGGAADAARSHLDRPASRCRARGGRCTSASSLVRCATRSSAPIENSLGDALLATRASSMLTNLVTSRSWNFGIRQHFPASHFTFARHDRPVLITSGRLAPYFDRPWLAVLHADRVERAAHDVVAHPGQVLDAAAADEHDRVLLQIVPDPGDVRRHLDAVGEPHARHLAQRRVRFLRRLRVDARAHAALLRRRAAAPAPPVLRRCLARPCFTS